MKRKFSLILFLLTLVLVTTGIVFTAPAPAMDIEESTWDTTFNIMYLSQEGTSVTGEYIYDDGYLTGTMEGQDLKGWWREAGNVKECGPGNAWSGPLIFRFANDWMSFKGDWGYCNQGIDDLDPDNPGKVWDGTRRDNDYFTEEECVAAGRYWCDGICQIEECGTDITQEECEEAGKIWCNGACQIEECGTTTTSVINTTTTIEPTTTTVPLTTTTTTTPADTTTTTPEVCPAGMACEEECPPDAPACGDDCCWTEFSYCCGDTSCCDNEDACCDGRCCRTGLCCGDLCCDEDQTCCGDKCCSTCCAGKCCAYDQVCSSSGECVFSISTCFSSRIYGKDSEEVELLRAFRDEVLSQSPVGQEIIELYYQLSPAIVKAMEEDEEFKEEVKEMVDSVLKMMGGVE